MFAMLFSIRVEKIKKLEGVLRLLKLHPDVRREALADDWKKLVLFREVPQQSLQHPRRVIWVVNVDTGVPSQNVLMQQVRVVVRNPRDEVRHGDVVAVQVDPAKIAHAFIGVTGLCGVCPGIAVRTDKLRVNDLRWNNVVEALESFLFYEPPAQYHQSYQ